MLARNLRTLLALLTLLCMQELQHLLGGDVFVRGATIGGGEDGDSKEQRGGLPHPLRPDIKSNDEENAPFWREYANNDLKRMLRLTKQMNEGRAKNVVIVVGDGFGIQTGTMARIFKGQQARKSGEETVLRWEEFPVTGLSKTYNTDHQVPDSAGTATALFSGVKTRMSMLGLDQQAAYNTCDATTEERARIKSMLHWAVEANMQTGIVTTSRLTHATPAALYSHTSNRNWESDVDLPPGATTCKDIARQLIESDVGRKVNVLFGGGRKNFVLEEDEGRRKDESLIDLYGELNRKEGREGTVLYNRSNLMFWDHANTDHVLGLFAPSHVDYEADRRARSAPEDAQPSLSDMTRVALNRLTGPKAKGKGFFLMVEAARIDHAHHDNNARRSLEEVLEMERALAEVLEHGKVNLAETLIVLTADHSHSVTMNGYPERGNSIFGYTHNVKRDLASFYSSGAREAMPTISYANGPGYFHHYLKREDRSISDVPWKNLMNENFEDLDYLQPAMMPGQDNSETHGGEDVAIYALGPQSHLLSGVHEQSYIAEVMAYSACVGNYSGECDRSTINGGMANQEAVFLLLGLLLVVRTAA